MNQDTKRLYRDDLLKLLEEIDKKLEGYQRKIRIYGIGGTVLMLNNFIDSSKDADFIVSRRDFVALTSHTAEIARKTNVRIDLIPDGDFGSFFYDQYAKHAIPMKFPFKHIEVLCIDKPAFVLTKALAGRIYDLADILHYVKPEELPKTELEERFKEIKIVEGKEDMLKKKLHAFMSEFYAPKNT